MSFVDVKVGDKIICCRGGWSATDYITEVERLTKTQIIAKNKERFRRDTGRRVGDAYSGYIRKIATDRDLKKIATRRELSTLTGKLSKLTNVSPEKMIKNIVEIIDVAEKLKAVSENYESI